MTDKYKIGDIVLHDISDYHNETNKSYYCSAVIGYEPDNNVLRIKTKFKIVNNKKVACDSIGGLITDNTIANKKLKKLLKKYPEYFI